MGKVVGSVLAQTASSNREGDGPQVTDPNQEALP